MFWWSIRARAWRSASNRASDLLGIHARLDDLERDPPSNRLVLLGHVHGAHASFADLLEQLVRADPVAGPLGQERCGGAIG